MISLIIRLVKWDYTVSLSAQLQASDNRWGLSTFDVTVAAAIYNRDTVAGFLSFDLVTLKALCQHNMYFLQGLRLV